MMMNRQIKIDYIISERTQRDYEEMDVSGSVRLIHGNKRSKHPSLEYEGKRYVFDSQKPVKWEEEEFKLMKFYCEYKNKRRYNRCLASVIVLEKEGRVFDARVSLRKHTHVLRKKVRRTASASRQLTDSRVPPPPESRVMRSNTFQQPVQMQMVKPTAPMMNQYNFQIHPNETLAPRTSYHHAYTHHCNNDSRRPTITAVRVEPKRYDYDIFMVKLYVVVPFDYDHNEVAVNYMLFTCSENTCKEGVVDDISFDRDNNVLSLTVMKANPKVRGKISIEGEITGGSSGGRSKVNKILVEDVFSFPRNTTNKRKRYNPFENLPRKSEIISVFPCQRDLRGGKVDIFFSLSQQSSMQRFLQPNAGQSVACSFGKDYSGKKRASVDSKITLAASYDHRDSLPEDLRQKISGSAILILDVWSPPWDHPQVVDIWIEGLGEHLSKANCFTYVDYRKPKGETKIEGEYAGEKKRDLQVFPRGSSSLEEGDEFGDDSEDSLFFNPNVYGVISMEQKKRIRLRETKKLSEGIWKSCSSPHDNEDGKKDEFDFLGGHKMCYLIAQNRIKEVVDYLERHPNFDASIHQDLLGVTPLKVAKYFKRNEILKILETPPSAWKKKILREKKIEVDITVDEYVSKKERKLESFDLYPEKTVGENLENLAAYIREEQKTDLDLDSLGFRLDWVFQKNDQLLRNCDPDFRKGVEVVVQKRPKIEKRVMEVSTDDYVLKIWKIGRSSPEYPIINAVKLDQNFAHAERFLLVAKKDGCYDFLFYADDGRTHSVRDAVTGKSWNVIDGMMPMELRKGEKVSFCGRNSVCWGLLLKFVGVS